MGVAPSRATKVVAQAKSTPPPTLCCHGGGRPICAILVRPRVIATCRLLMEEMRNQVPLGAQAIKTTAFFSTSKT
ncbi:hypothetical protein BDA96_10G194700 [Sorghum bicolor]|uniref:Uncharacterized protein n=1 Tax=Sorghum bicolor TaxID=4558 RepID=A0A921Q556_SORBI|nr:hypothetical protein BDA96_10G194700 [Sorghum bicolor]